MKKFTFDDIMDLRPCYPTDEIEAIMGDGMTLLDGLDLPIPLADRIWVAARLLTSESATRFMCRCGRDYWPINPCHIVYASEFHASDIAWRLLDVEGNTKNYDVIYNEELQKQIDWLKKEVAG